MIFFARAVALALGIFSIILHEIAHGAAAHALGDPTAKRLGRLTLNPVKHVDPFMTIILPLILYISTQGRFIFGGAKPVPVNPYLLRPDMRTGMMLTGLAGPTVNIAIALAVALILRLNELAGLPLSSLLVYVFSSVGLWNMLIAFFNLVPIPPLDGSRVAIYFMPRSFAEHYEQLERYGILLVGIAIFSGILRPVFDFAVRVFVLFAGSSWVPVYIDFSM